MTDADLERLRAAYPQLPDAAPPPATVARVQARYADEDAVPGDGARRRDRRRWRPSRRLGLLALGGVVLSGTALAATGGWHPVLGSADHGPRPQAARADVPAAQLSALAVLRRRQTDADRGALVRRALKVLDRHAINGIHTGAIRVISREPRELSVLVPAERFGHRLPLGPDGTRPAVSGIQRDALCLMSTSRQDRPRSFTTTSHGKSRTVRFPAGYTGWGVTCGGLDMLRTTGIGTGTSPDGSGGLVVNGHPENITIRRVTLVPDGVARVTVRLRHGRSVTVPVRDNVYRYTTHDIPIQLGTIWYDAAGRRVDHRQK